MRFKMPKHGDIRVKTKFAILPIEIYGEVRWMETVKIRQCYDSPSHKWFDNSFVD